MRMLVKVSMIRFQSNFAEGMLSRDLAETDTTSDVMVVIVVLSRLLQRLKSSGVLRMTALRIMIQKHPCTS